MGAIVLPKRLHPDFSHKWRKPVGAVKARLDIPFLAAYQNSPHDIAGNQRGTMFGNASLVKNGFRRTGTGNTDGYIQYPNNNRAWGSGAYTVLLVIHFEQGPLSSSADGIFEKPYTSASEPFYVCQIKRNPSSSGGAISVHFNCGGVRYNFGGANSIPAGRYAIIFANQSGSQKLRIYNDKGQLFDSASRTNSGTPTNYSTPSYFGYTLLTAAGYTNKVFELVGVDNHAWSDSEMESFGRDPFGYLLNPAVPMFYMPAAAGGGFSPYWAAGSNVLMNNGSL